MIRHIAAAASCTLLWIVFLGPQSVDPAHRIGYVGDPLHPRLEWRALRVEVVDGPSRLWEFNAFYLTQHALTTTEPRFLPSLWSIEFTR